MLELFSTDQLLHLYQIAIEEYRFEVKLNWDRTAYHLTLNCGLIAVATGLLKVGSAPVVNLFVAGVFFIGLCAAGIAILTIRKGHEYYRNTIIKKTLLEDQLGLNRQISEYASRPTRAIGTTHGQGEHFKILNETEAWLKRPHRRGGVTFWIVVILWLFLVANAAGIAGCVWLYAHPSKGTQSSSIIKGI